MGVAPGSSVPGAGGSSGAQGGGLFVVKNARLQAFARIGRGGCRGQGPMWRCRLLGGSRCGGGVVAGGTLRAQHLQRFGANLLPQALRLGLLGVTRSALRSQPLGVGVVTGIGQQQGDDGKAQWAGLSEGVLRGWRDTAGAR